jgi:cytochrome P450
MLAMHSEVQTKAFQEAQAFFLGLEGPMATRDISNLKYLDMVIKETMRLFPAAAMLGRTSSADIQLGLAW